MEATGLAVDLFGGGSIAGRNISTGIWGGGSSSFGQASYSQMPSAGTGSINMRNVNNQRNWDIANHEFDGLGGYYPYEGNTSGDGYEGGVEAAPSSGTRVWNWTVGKASDYVDKVVNTATGVPVSALNGFSYGWTELTTGKRRVLTDSQKWKPWRFSLQGEHLFYQETPSYGSYNTVSRAEGARLIGGTTVLIVPPFARSFIPMTIKTPLSVIMGTGVPYTIQE